MWIAFAFALPAALAGVSITRRHQLRHLHLERRVAEIAIWAAGRARWD